MKWINIKTQQPEQGDVVMILVEKEHEKQELIFRVKIGRYVGGTEFIAPMGYGVEVTHWTRVEEPEE